MARVLLFLLAALVAPHSFSASAFAQPLPSRLDLSGGVIGGLTRVYAVQFGATAWPLERLGLSARAGSTGGTPWLDLMIRHRGFVREERDVEIDFGVGRGIFFDDRYHHSWTVDMLVGVRPYDRVGFKFGGGFVFAYKGPKRPPDGRRNLDIGILVNAVIVVRP